MTNENISLPFRLSYHLTRADVAAYERLPREFTRSEILTFFGVFFICGMLLAAFEDEVGIISLLPGGYRSIASSIAAALFAYAICVLALTLRTNWRIAKAEIPPNEIEFEASRSDLKIGGGYAPRTLSWSSIARVIAAPGHVFLCLTPKNAVILPLRAFPSAGDMHAFASLSETLSRSADDV